MDTKALERYFNLYSEGRFDEAITEHYREDAHFWNTRIELTGRQKIIDWLCASHNGYTEKLIPLSIFFDTDGAAVELQQEFHAVTDLSSFYIRPLKTGEVLKTRGVCQFFRFQEGRIASVKEYVLLYKCDPSVFMAGT